MSKGSKRRRENAALVEANWEACFGKQERAAPSVLNSQMEGQAQGSARQGATVQDVRTPGQGDSSNGM